MRAPTKSPLDEANTPSLDAFFDREPEDLTDDPLEPDDLPFTTHFFRYADGQYR